MKFISIFLLLLLSFSFCDAQNELLGVDEQGKFIYYELVEINGMPSAQLSEKVTDFLKKTFKDVKQKEVHGDSSFMAVGKLVINKTVLVMSHPSGEISYHFRAEVKDGKYRFWLSNFNFIPYYRDRYGNFVAATHKGTPLENNPGKLNAVQWREYQIQAAQYAHHFAQSFKDYMIGKTETPNDRLERTIVKKNW
ncbi:DUF4468 domain-containing protein [Pedobacter insulae]|uniref:DUF4468 domain-containing protein n=1 Tax=Pedobacter insulae TaxID=414048 RepID=A0A1I2XTL9_9SPHI|nr:DUF4468 domain-containing protein [Pedobacter insulae]SFH16834.1 protein of unknown function [Pedobacter insulae]